MGAAVKSGWEQRAQASGQVQPGVGGAELAWRPSGSRHPRSREDWPVQVQAVPSEAATSPGGRPKQGLLQVTPPPTKNQNTSFSLRTEHVHREMLWMY